MADNRKLMNAMIPLVMDMLDIDVDDVLFSDILSDDQITDVVMAVVVQDKLQSEHKRININSIRIDYEEENEQKTLLENAVVLPSSSPNCWSVVPSKDFRSIYRMTTIVFQDLLQLIVQESQTMPTLFPFTASTGRNEIPNERKLLITLEYLGSNLPISKLSQKYNLSETVTVQAISKIIASIYQLMQLFIHWPEEENLLHPTLHPLLNGTGLSKCVGIIDVCHINIKTPSVHESFYLNKIGRSSVALQAVCDNNLNFIHCCTGWPGSVAELNVLKDSDLYQDVQACPEKFFPYDTFIVGDVAYPLLHWLITPYYNPDGDEKQIKFNHIHSQVHNVIHEAFQRLKLRFPRMNYIGISKMEDVVKTVLVCCALHNFCQNRGDVMSGETTAEPYVAINTFSNVEEYKRTNLVAMEKRESIAEIVNETTMIHMI